MDFDLSEEQKMIQETIRKFAKEEIAPVASENDKKGHFPREILQVHLYLKNMAVQDLITSVMPLWLKRLAEWILLFEARILSKFPLLSFPYINLPTRNRRRNIFPSWPVESGWDVMA